MFLFHFSNAEHSVIKCFSVLEEILTYCQNCPYFKENVSSKPTNRIFL